MTSPTPSPPGNPGGLPPGLSPGATPPSAGWIPVGAGAPPGVPPAATAGGSGRRGRPVLSVLGILLILGGIGAAIGLAVTGNQRYSDGIERLARGPAGCRTTLEVTEDATYFFYLETKGHVGDVRGTCPVSGESFDARRARDATISLKNDDGDTVRLRRASGVTYDAGGYAGELASTARLEPGRYSLTVEGSDDVVVAVGRDVEDLESNLVLPIVIGAVGLILGLALLVLGRRGRSADAAPASPAGPPPPGPAWGLQPPPPTGR